MKTTILIFLVCFSHSAIAESYKCIQSGRTTYSSFPCGDNAQVVTDHVTAYDGSPQTIYHKPYSVQAAPVQEVAPIQVAAPALSCANEEAEFESVKKSMHVGYPASQSNYWHKRLVDTRDAYDLCRERQQKNANK